MFKFNTFLAVSSVVLSMTCLTACSDDTPDNNDPLPPYKPLTPPTPPTPEPTDDPIDITKGMATLDNGQICLKQDMDRGGSISYLSRSGENRSVVNIHDEGRLIQQSYYAGHVIDRQKDGQSKDWSPWSWNPIQGGNYAGKKSRVIEGKLTKTSLYVKCAPMQWDMNNHEADAIMEQWTELEGNVVHVRNRFTINSIPDVYGGPGEHDQEIPAVYPISALSNLYAYRGDKPFTKAAASKLDLVQLTNGSWGRYSDITEKWMAFVDDKSWGLAVYSPEATHFNAGIAGTTGGEALSPSTCHVAPLFRKTLKSGDVLEYNYYLILDKLDAIRTTIYDIRNKSNEK